MNEEYLLSLSQDILSAHDFIARLLTFPPDKPVLLWTAPSWRDRLAFWWTLDALFRARLSVNRFWVVEPALPYPEDPFPGSSLGTYPVVAFRSSVTKMRPLDTRILQAGSRLWRAYAGRSAIAFDAARRHGRRYFPELLRITDAYGCFFPQAVGRQRVRLTLSEFDQAVLDRLHVKNWLRPVDLLRRDARMFDFFSYFGDLFLPRRLRDWARHAPRQPAVLMREEANAVNEYTAYSFRLTAFGMRLRERGLESPDQAPSMFIGGCRVYGTKPTWIRRNRGKHWHIEKLDA